MAQDTATPQMCACRESVARELAPGDGCTFCGAYVTPEGHWLSKRILLPDARTFSDVLEYLGEWEDFEREHPSIDADHYPLEQPGARYLDNSGAAGDLVRGILDIGREIGVDFPPDDPQARNRIGPFCRFRGSRRPIAVRAADCVLDAVRGRIVTPDDRLSFEIIEHEDRGRALVVLSHGMISGSHWLAYIDPATIPPYPYAARDARKREIYDALDAEGLRPMLRARDKDAPGDVTVIARNSPPLAATIHADGSVTRTWKDGTTAHEPAAGLP